MKRAPHFKQRFPTRRPLFTRLLYALASPLGLMLVGLASAAVAIVWGRRP